MCGLCAVEYSVSVLGCDFFRVSYSLQYVGNSGNSPWKLWVYKILIALENPQLAVLVKESLFHLYCQLKYQGEFDCTALSPCSFLKQWVIEAGVEERTEDNDCEDLDLVLNSWARRLDQIYLNHVDWNGIQVVLQRATGKINTLINFVQKSTLFSENYCLSHFKT